jgi:hypothetical protein
MAGGSRLACGPRTGKLQWHHHHEETIKLLGYSQQPRYQRQWHPQKTYRKGLKTLLRTEESTPRSSRKKAGAR